MAGKIQVIVLSCLIFIIFISGAEALTLPQNQTAQICHAVRVDDGIVSGVECNITILHPNSSRLIDFQPMDDEIDRFCFNLTGTQTTIKGIYDYEVTCVAPNGNNETQSFNYIVNLGGVEPSQQRTDTITRSIYFMFGIGIILFLGFFFTKNVPIKWTYFLLSLLFFLIAINILFVSLQDEIVNPTMENLFSFFTTVSFIIYRFIAFLIGALWVVTIFVTIFIKMKNSKARRFAEGE